MLKNWIEPRLALGRRIKLGGLGEERKSKSGNTYRRPVKFDEIVVAKNERGEDGNFTRDEELMAKLREEGGGKVNEVPIVLLSDDIDEVLITRAARYAGRRLHCSGDGETATRHELKDGQPTGRTKELPCPCTFKDDGSCKPHAILNCMISVPGFATAGAVDQFRTTGVISISHLTASLMQIQSLTGGVLTGLPLVLKRKQVDVTPKGGKPTKVPAVHIELRSGDVREIQRQALEHVQFRNQHAARFRQLERQYRAMLTAPAENETPEEQELINAEFSPDTTGDTPADEVTKPGSSVEDAKARIQEAIFKSEELREEQRLKEIRK